MFRLLNTRIVRPYRSSVAVEEETVWVAFYRRIADPAIAAEVILYLDADADLKRTHPALYLRCKESLRKKKVRLARMKRIRSFVRAIFGLSRVNNMRPRLRHGAPMAVPSLPESTRAAASASRRDAPRNDKAA